MPHQSTAQQNYLDNETSLIQQSLNSNRTAESSHNDLLALSGSANQHNIRNESRFSAANPLLAEKLLSPSLSDLDNLTISNGRLIRPRDIKGMSIYYFVLRLRIEKITEFSTLLPFATQRLSKVF